MLNSLFLHPSYKQNGTECDKRYDEFKTYMEETIFPLFTMFLDKSNSDPSFSRSEIIWIASEDMFSFDDKAENMTEDRPRAFRKRQLRLEQNRVMRKQRNKNLLSLDT